MHGKMKIPAYTGRDPYIFISYAHKNDAEVFNILEELQLEKVRFYYDEGIEPSKAWAEELAKHIDGSKGMLVFMTPEYLQSENCQDELAYAKDGNKPMLIIYLRKTELTSGWKMQLNRKQNLKKFQFESDAAFYKKLLATEMIAICREKTDAVSGSAANTAAERKQRENKGEGTKNYQDVKEQFIQTMVEKAIEGEKRHARSSQGGSLLHQLDKAWRDSRISQDSSLLHQLDEDRRNSRISHGKQIQQMAEIWENRIKATKAKALPVMGKLEEKSIQLALEGDCDMRYRVGKKYLEGNGVDKDPHQAAVWFLHAAVEGHAAAQLETGKCALFGRGFAKNYTEAVRYLKQAAEQGSGEANYWLGRCYEEGAGVQKDEQEAKRLFLKAQERGYEPAALALQMELDLRKAKEIDLI